MANTFSQATRLPLARTITAAAYPTTQAAVRAIDNRYTPAQLDQAVFDQVKINAQREFSRSVTPQTSDGGAIPGVDINGNVTGYGEYGQTEIQQVVRESKREQDYAVEVWKKEQAAKGAKTKAKVPPTVKKTGTPNLVVTPDSTAPTKTQKPAPAKLAYPLDIESARYRMNIMLAPYDDTVALRNASIASHDCIITLPVPSAIQDATGLDYSNVNLGMFGGEFLKAAQDVYRDYDKTGDPVGSLRRAIGRGYNELKTRDLQEALLRRVVAGQSQALGAAFDLTAGSTPNPHVAVTFNNVKLRTFAYSWRFSPNSKEESEAVVNIVKTFNSRILPGKGNDYLLKYPNQCLIKLDPVQLNELMKYRPCVITDMSVNYAPSGIPAFFAGTNLPVEIELALSFQEIQIRTAEDYK